MPSIDNRIVEMQFNNAQFERGVNQSLGTLDKLKATLKLDNAAKGFDNISNTANRMDFSGLTGAISSVSTRFSVLEIAAITAIQNIANRLTNFGINFAKSLSVDQIVAGWNKFALKAQSVNTIMAATGESVEVVGSQLDKLNRYTDETSASFTDMTSNIGKFTNAGVKLEDATQAMQGITNWAYLSGASVSEAGRAMYNLSQAMAVGSVKLIDWKSIENANMATTKFKQTAIDTAVAMGQLKDKGDGVYKTLKGNEVTVKNFNEALKDQWFSSEVLSATLDKFGSFSTDIIELADETGITVVQLMDHFKDFENNNINYEVIAQGTGKSADEIRQAFLTMGTASNSISKRLINDSNKVKSTFEKRAAAISESTGEEVTAQELLTRALNDAYSESEGDVKRFKTALNDTGISAKNLESIFQEMKDNQVLGVAAFRAAQEYRSFRDAVDATIDAVSTGWMKTFELIFGNAEEAKRVWGALGEMFYEVFASGAEERNKMLSIWHDSDLGGYLSFVNAIENITAAVIGLKEQIGEVFRDSFLNIDRNDVDLLNSLTIKFENFSLVLKAIGTGNMDDLFGVLDAELPKIAKDLDNIDMSELVGEKNYEAATRGATTLKSIIEGIAHAFDIARTIVQGIGIALQPVFSFAKSVGSDILDLIDAIALRLGAINEDQSENGGIIGFFTNIRNKIGPILNWLSGVVHSFMSVLTNIINPETEGSFKDFGESFSMVFNKIGEVCKKVFPILSSIGHAIGNAITIAVDKIKEFMENASVQEFFDLLKGGIGVGIFAGINKLISNLSGSAGNLKEGGILGMIFGSGKGKGGGIGDTLKSLPDQIADFATRIGDSVKKFVDIEAFKAFGSALLMIAGALFILSMIPTESLGDSLGTLALAMAGIIGVMELFAKSSAAESGKMLAAGIAFAALAGGVLILSAALFIMALIPAERINNALTALAGALIEVVAALAVMQVMDPVRLIASAAALLILAPALIMMAAAIAILALIPADKAANAIETLFDALVLVVGALALLSFVGPMAIVAAAALLILSPALILIAAALGLLALIPADKIESVIVTLGLVLAELTAALIALSLAGPMALVAAAALLILSPALILIAAALLMLSVIPMEAIGTSLIALGGALMILVAAAWAVAPVVGPLLALAASFLAIAAATVILGVGLAAIAAGILALVAAGSLLVSVVVAALESVVTAALSLVSNLFQLGADLINAVIEGIKSMIGDLPQVAQDIINGLVNGLVGMASSVFQAAANIGRGILDSIKGALGIASPSKEMISLMGYVGSGLELGANKVITQAEHIGNAIGNALTEGTQEGMSDMSSLYGSPTIRPVTDLSQIQNGSYSGFGTGAMPYTNYALAGMGFGVSGTRDLNQTTTTNAPVFNIYQQPGQDPEALARIINRELGRMYVR